MNIYKFLSTYKSSIVLLLVFGLVFLVSRLYLLGDFPIFTDEAIYVRWAQIAKNDAVWRFISLTDGKQPMFVWIAMVIMRFVEDPLVAGRLVSVIAGFFSMIGLYLVGKTLFHNERVGLVSSLLYVVYPFALVYDRMALYDSLVGMFAVWSLYFSILLARTLRLDIALILGMIVGGGMLTKTNAFFNLLPISILIFNFSLKKNTERVIKFLGLYGVVIVLAFMFYAVLRLSPFFHIIAEKNALFVYPFNEWREHPFTYFGNNLQGVWDWFWKYMTIPWILFVLVSLGIKKENLQEKLLLIAYFLVPFVYLTFFGRTIYPRFIFFMTLSLLPLVAYSFVNLSTFVKQKYLLYGLCVLLFILPLRADYFILHDFGNAPIPVSDKHQYYTDWPSGVGVKEATAFFRKESEKGKIYIATQGTFGLMPFSLEIYLVDKPNIILKGFWPIEKELPKELVDARTKYPTYYLAYQPCDICRDKGLAPDTWPLKLVLQVPKQHGGFLSVYQVTQ